MLENNRGRIESEAILDEGFALSLGDKAINKNILKGNSFWWNYETRADDILERAQSAGISVLHPYMSAYPKRLLFNKRFPPILFCRGNIDILNEEKIVAIIGTREPTEFGCRMGQRLAEILVNEGYVIVSGLALGCDTIGHEGALTAGGKTIAVLPTPIDATVYPEKNQPLSECILKNDGLLISEYPPGVELRGKQLVNNLVARDEWQPGLSDGLVVIETSATGGSNHALRYALSTDTPIAVFDYSHKDNIDFYRDERFGGNVEYIKNCQSGNITPIFEASTIEVFKKKMEEYRAVIHGSPWEKPITTKCGGQQMVFFDLLV
ncbi:MAG: DNA-processing protein DprA [Gordonibacter sp.]|uniref:DNA-processing protein DprA n=1 Tax=Gordonibacter sp. TaxID=1968902 RepID=UPI002FC96377